MATSQRRPASVESINVETFPRGFCVDMRLDGSRETDQATQLTFVSPQFCTYIMIGRPGLPKVVIS